MPTVDLPGDSTELQGVPSAPYGPTVAHGEPHSGPATASSRPSSNRGCSIREQHNPAAAAILSLLSHPEGAMDRRLLLLVLPGCFQPYQDLPDLDFSEMSFERPGLESDSAVVRAFDLDTHICPDGEPARIYAVYNEGAEESAPVAVVLHSGAFDFIVSYEDGEAPLEGRNYRTESRLERSWALAKVWETFGMLPTPIDAGEENAGTLPVAMLNAGWVQLYPANCWGDLWHFDAEVNPNDADTEGFERDGLGLAMEAVRPSTPGAAVRSDSVPVPWISACSWWTRRRRARRDRNPVTPTWTPPSHESCSTAPPTSPAPMSTTRQPGSTRSLVWRPSTAKDSAKTLTQSACSRSSRPARSPSRSGLSGLHSTTPSRPPLPHRSHPQWRPPATPILWSKTRAPVMCSPTPTPCWPKRWSPG